MRYSHRFFLYAPVGAIVALAVAASIYWDVTANAFAKRLAALNGHAIAPGVTIHFTSQSVGGFPFRVDDVLQNLRLAIATPDGPVSWTTQHFALHMLDYSGEHLIFEAAGKQTFAWRDRAGVTHSFAFTPALLRASSLGHSGRLSRVDIELYGAKTPDFDVAHTELHVRRDPDKDALDVVVMADDLRLISGLDTGLGDKISKLRIKGMLAPAAEWNALLAGRNNWRSALEAWRARSGTFDISGIRIDWGKTDVDGTGMLMLDGARRPTGLIKLRITGAQALASTAKPQTADDGNKGLLAALAAEASTAKANSPLAVTLAFKDGLAYVGNRPVGFVGPIY